MAKHRFGRGFVVRNKEGKFLCKNGEWVVRATVFEAFMFMGDRIDIEGFAKVNNLDDDCELFSFSFIKIDGKRRAGNRLKKAGSFLFKTLPWLESGNWTEAKWAKE